MLSKQRTLFHDSGSPWGNGLLYLFYPKKIKVFSESDLDPKVQKMCISWACDLLPEMLLTLNNFSSWLFENKCWIWPSKKMFVWRQSMAETCASHWGNVICTYYSFFCEIAFCLREKCNLMWGLSQNLRRCPTRREAGSRREFPWFLARCSSLFIDEYLFLVHMRCTAQECRYIDLLALRGSL